jgi:hypothetical protein
MGPIAEAIFTANKDVLMKEGKKIVDAASKVSGGLDLSGVSLTPKATEAPAGGEGASTEAEAAAA